MMPSKKPEKKYSFEQDLIKKIGEKIITKEELISLLLELEKTEDFAFRYKKENIFKKLEKKTTPLFYYFLKEWERKKLFPSSPQKQISFLQKVKETLQKIPQVRIEIPFDPPREILLKIKRKIEEYTGKQIIIDLHINPELIGGLTIEYQGKYFDGSLRGKINREFIKEILSK